MKIPIDKIVIGPRQRIDIGDLSDLDSMSDPDVGLIQRIGVNDRNQLLWGRRRLAKAVELGWKEIDADVKTGLTPEQEQLIEWSEDFDRKNRTWQENCLALAKLHRMMEMQTGFSTGSTQRGGSGSWTVRKTEQLTGISKSKVSVMLIVADALERELEDHKAGKETVWSVSAYTEAYKTLVQRHEAEINTEIERRRTLKNPPVVAGVTEEPAVGNVQTMDTTAEEPPPTKSVVRLRGRCSAYSLTPASEVGNLQTIVLAWRPTPQDVPMLYKDLRDNGFAIYWYPSFHEYEKAIDAFCLHHLYVMPYPLIWNKVQPIGNSGWPFAPNMAYGLVASKSEQILCAEPISSVVSAVPDGDNLPTSVIDMSISHIRINNMAVTCVCGIDPVSVVELGHVPIWHEPDKEKFDATNARLKAYYEEQLPNVEVIT